MSLKKLTAQDLLNKNYQSAWGVYAKEKITLPDSTTRTGEYMIVRDLTCVKSPYNNMYEVRYKVNGINKFFLIPPDYDGEDYVVDPKDPNKEHKLLTTIADD